MSERLNLNDAEARAILRAVHAAAIEAALPGPAMRGHIPPPPRGRCVVVGAGKASAAMAAALDRALHEAWGPQVPVSGVVATRYGHAVAAGRIEIVEAGHPVPDANSVMAARRVMSAVAGLGPDDLVIALVSGGGSACMEWPVDGMELDDLRALGRALLESGAGIGEINLVRRHLSRVKGGRLAAAAAPARVYTLLISDIPGDDPAAIASGPTLADGTTAQDALAIIERYGLPVPNAVRRAMLVAPACTAAGEYRIIASPQQALIAAADKARELGLTPLLLGDAIEAEARELGRVMAGIALSVRQWGQPVAAPALLLSGGEASVTLAGGSFGKGGRNTELALSLALSLQGAPGIWALAADSDGIDGSEDAAGAIIAPDTLTRGADQALNGADFLARHDSYSYFAALDDLLITGPTLTNVNDIRLILVA
ncbi:glycerate kinase type-2 family protein [Novosphingobium sp. KACC 22771]|uniref:glycerate kinase type-2 family protein n=1 Tax=Novosphingobium sp. KACC 22771 TaxID=3025670 RepID=UPI0023671762|nr:glycerate kinase [Novosphingobium sp. KACC 22771]WDF74502.1 glycerate kinase [Novosphingobium sp. KACC 22771]